MSLVAAIPAHSADTTQVEGLEEIVVTSTKRGDSVLMETPLTVQAFAADTLTNRGATDFNDIARMIPGLGMDDLGPGTKRYGMRGVFAAGAGTVGVYLDDIVITGENAGFSGGGLQPDPRLFDMERIEVLKGPQGTTFGSSALTGVVRYITNKPVFNEVSGSVRAAGNLQEGADLGYSADGAINVPVIDDRLALRVSGFYQDKPGYISNRYEDDASGEETYAGRVAGRLQVTDKSTLDLMVMYQKSDFGLQYYNIKDFSGNPVKEYYQSPPERGGYEDEIEFYNLAYNYDLGFGSITATGSWMKREVYTNAFASQVLARAAGYANAETPGVASTVNNVRNRNLDTYEVRFASDWEGPLQLLTGIFYQDETRSLDSNILTVNSSGFIDPASGVIFGHTLQNRTLYTQVTEKAVFGELTWQVSDKVKLTAGARAFRFDDSSFGVVRTALIGRVGAGRGPSADSDEESVIGRFIASYDLLDNTMVYAQVAQGYRPGGTNDQAAASLGGTTVPEGFTSDAIVNYELGLKHTSADNRFSATVAAFYIDWTDMQVSLRTPATAQFPTQYGYIGNAGKARSYGTEIELHWRPVRALDLSLVTAYTDAKIEESVLNAGVSGDRVPYTPEYTVAGSADLTFPLTSTIKGFVGGDVSWQSDRPTNFPSAGASYVMLDEQTLLNLRAGVDLDAWRLALIVRNVTDEDTVSDISFQTPNLDSYHRMNPRMVTLEASTKF